MKIEWWHVVLGAGAVWFVASKATSSAYPQMTPAQRQAPDTLMPGQCVCIVAGQYAACPPGAPCYSQVS